MTFTSAPTGTACGRATRCELQPGHVRGHVLDRHRGVGATLFVQFQSVPVVAPRDGDVLLCVRVRDGRRKLEDLFPALPGALQVHDLGLDRRIRMIDRSPCLDCEIGNISDDEPGKAAGLFDGANAHRRYGDEHERRRNPDQRHRRTPGPRWARLVLTECTECSKSAHDGSGRVA